MESQQTAKTESAGSSPPPKKETKKDLPRTESDKPAVGRSYQLKTEVPSVPATLDQSSQQLALDLPASGNQAYTIEMKDKGIIGLHFDRAKTAPIPEMLEIDPNAFFYGIRNTLHGVLLRLHRLKTQLSDQDFAPRAEELATTLSTGCSLVAYLKIRSIILSECQEKYSPTNLRRPRASADLPIPQAFAFAIQQLGTVNVADLPYERKLMPCFPMSGHLYGIPPGSAWNPNAYAMAVEYARSLGMRFQIVDLKVKNGSAWWLFRQYYEDGIFELQAPLPEVNFTDSMAVTHTLFLNGQNPDPSNPFVDLSIFPINDEYGVFLQNPHPGINLSTYEAIGETAQEVWSNV